MLSICTSSIIVALFGAAMAIASEQCSGTDVLKLEGYGSGTTGGGSGAPVIVQTCTEFKAAASQGGVIQVRGWLYDCGIVDIVDDTTVQGESVGALSAEKLGSALRIKDAKNVIIRNMAFRASIQGLGSLVVENSTQIWIDHNDFLMGRPWPGEDNPPGLSILNSDLVSVQFNFFFDSWKGVVVEGSNSHDEQPRVTFHHNMFMWLANRTPSISDATVHFYSNCVELDLKTGNYGVSVSNDAKVLIEKSAFYHTTQAIITNMDPENEGFVTERDNFYYNSTTSITKTGHVEPTYEYTGQTLRIGRPWEDGRRRTEVLSRAR